MLHLRLVYGGILVSLAFLGQFQFEPGSCFPLPGLAPEAHLPLPYDGNIIYAKVYDNQQFLVTDPTFPSLLKSSPRQEQESGRLALIPPSGFGFMVVLRWLSMRLENACDPRLFGSECAPKCLDYLQFSTIDKKSNETCGFMNSEAGIVEVIELVGDVSFTGGIDQMLFIDIQQQVDKPGFYMGDFPEYPVFEVVISAYSECSSGKPGMLQCPSAPGSNDHSPYCIAENLFCDGTINCPAPGLKTYTLEDMVTGGMGTEEENCASKELLEALDDSASDQAGSYDVKVLTFDNRPAVLQSYSNAMVQANVADEGDMDDWGDEKSNSNSNSAEQLFSATGPVVVVAPTANSMDIRDIYHGPWILVITLGSMLLYCLARWWFRSETNRIVIRHANPLYQKIKNQNDKKVLCAIISINKAKKANATNANANPLSVPLTKK